jgi:hypothetical protein
MEPKALRRHLRLKLGLLELLLHLHLLYTPERVLRNVAFRISAQYDEVQCHKPTVRIPSLTSCDAAPVTSLCDRLRMMLLQCIMPEHAAIQ